MSCLIPLDLFYGQMHKFLPVGYRFRPTDDELVNHYLRGQIFRYNADTCIIPVIHGLYNIDPWDLPLRFRAFSIVRSKEAEWWFLTRLSFKTESRSKFDRQTQSGHWKTTGQEKKINAKGTKELIGTMRNLVFTENEGSNRKETPPPTVWVMHEYRLKDCNFGTNSLDQQNFVLCHLINRRDEFIDDSVSAEAGSMSLFTNMNNDRAQNNIPERPYTHQ
ncbi:protein NTM1-like 9 [Rhodamnia argentea]|uniref:Protein NTM1-like 9 n=1 Tax=Rhodamnia argentea TaxID=178133 RepID=A0A8B8MZJ8_9MYRT|nr:protein NTM1-like 9 [Rhodamnia argentea]